MYCKYCPYNSPNPEDVFRHMIDTHGMTRETTPQHLLQFWQTHSPQGYYESPNPITGVAKQHQLNAQAAQTVSVFNPNPNQRITIQPNIVPEPWQRVDENYYNINENIINEPLRKVIVTGKLTPGHGIVEIFKTETHEKHSIINAITGNVSTETVENKQTLVEEFRPFTKSIEYKTWEQHFMENSATQINLIKSKLLGTEF